jgi:hypothetical protein
VNDSTGVVAAGDDIDHSLDDNFSDNFSHNDTDILSHNDTEFEGPHHPGPPPVMAEDTLHATN